MSDVKKRFEAAVQVIRNLPKNQTYQPSKELMLRFYSLYKQATTGPCELPRPAFWDVVNKAKWESWNSLKDMSSSEAMVLYVEELKKVIETMPHSVDVGNFLQTLGSFYEIVDLDSQKDIAKEATKCQSAISRSLESLTDDKCSEDSFYEVAPSYFGQFDVQETIKKLQGDMDALNQRVAIIESKPRPHMCLCQFIDKMHRYLRKFPVVLLIGMTLPLWTLLWFVMFRIVPLLRRLVLGRRSRRCP